MPDATVTATQKVSVIVPARNAEDSLPATLDAVLAQDYAGAIEVIVADGSDTPATAEMLRRRYPTVRRVPNPARTTAAGLNRALRAATGEIVVRCDAHAMLSPCHVRRAVGTLARTGAANVGGPQNVVGTSLVGRAFARAVGTLVGSGGARHRMGGREGLSTVTEKSVILDRTSTTTCRGCMGRHRRQKPVWPSVRGAGVKAGSPAQRGRSEATRLDAGEHTRTLLV